MKRGFTDSPIAALGAVDDGAVILIGGFGEAGNPTELVHALIDTGARHLTIVNNNAGNGEIGLAALLATGRVDRLICSYPRGSHSHVFEQLFRSGKIELELVPQGTLAERIRAGGAGIPAFFTPTGAGTLLAQDKESRMFGERLCVMETAIRGDLALIKAKAADRFRNLSFNKTARNFNPVMCMAATRSIVQVEQFLDEAIDPESIITPGIFVDVVVKIEAPIREHQHLKVTAL
jgi:3-oxoadipate CoA-transferase alpha subunit